MFPQVKIRFLFPHFEHIFVFVSASKNMFNLDRPFQHHFVNSSIWVSKTKTEKQQLFNKFLKDSKSGFNTNYVTSTDGIRIVPTPTGGKIPGQIKRKRNAKTTTISNNARKLNFH